MRRKKKREKRKEQPVSLGPSHNDCSWLSFSNPSISPRPRELTLRDQKHAPAASHIGTKKRREKKAAKSKSETQKKFVAWEKKSKRRRQFFVRLLVVILGG